MFLKFISQQKETPRAFNPRRLKLTLDRGYLFDVNHGVKIEGDIYGRQRKWFCAKQNRTRKY